MSDPNCIKVAIRIRPLVSIELQQGFQSIIKRIPNEPQIVIDGTRNDKHAYTFNHVFSSDDGQETVYIESVENMIEKLFEGYNVTILAYGQTGSGKTFTMGTSYSGDDNNKKGVIQRAVGDIFDTIDELSDTHQISVKCSFIELYIEQLYDLLSEESRDDCVVDIREDGKKGIVIPGLTEIEVNSMDETIECLISGSNKRATGATAMNAESSRSHAIFTIVLEIAKLDDLSMKTKSRFHLVDLAGSERPKKTKATGKRFKEGVEINKGLFILGNVISALGENASHIPYRNSKLTRLLQDSLGGNSVTLLIACVSPADSNMEETLNTLKYADRAKKIKNKPIVNVDSNSAEIERLNLVLQSLKLELYQLENFTPSEDTSDENTDRKSNILRVCVAHLKQQLQSGIETNHLLQRQIQNAFKDVVNVELRTELAEQTFVLLNEKIKPFRECVDALQCDFNTNTCPEQFQKHYNDLKSVQQMVCDMNNILSRTKLGIENSSVNSEMYFSTSNSLTAEEQYEISSYEDTSNSNEMEVEEHIEQFQKKQIGFSDQLRELNKNIAMKEELQIKFLGNQSHFISCDDLNTTDKIQQFEDKIKKLEAELFQLLQITKSSDKSQITTAKLENERQQKISRLEIQIEDMKKKFKHQINLLKLREADAERIELLKKEILEMKTCKVKLIRAMKIENDKFQKWKRSKSLELSKLKDKERKFKNKLARLSNMNIKKQNVLKRKIAEASATTKRLEIAIEKQKVAQEGRRKGNGKIDINVWLENDIEIILSIVESQCNLEILISARDTQKTYLQKQQSKRPINMSEIEQIEKDILVLNKQINDAHQHIVSTKLEDKMKKIYNELNGTIENRECVKFLFNSISDLQKEYLTKVNQNEACKQNIENLKKTKKLLEFEGNAVKTEYNKQANEIIKDNEERISKLVNELKSKKKSHNDTEDSKLKVHEEIQKKKDEFLAILQQLEKENGELEKKSINKQKMPKRVTHKTNTISYTGVNYSFFDTSHEEGSEMETDDTTNDPDWERSPMLRLHRSQDSFSTSKTNETFKKPNVQNLRCGCKTGCQTKICKCRKNNRKCDENCSCADCKNSILTEKIINDENNRIATHNGIFNSTVNSQDSDSDSGHASTPKKIGLLSLSPVTHDITTPTYPFENKKRTPFFEN